MSKNQTIKKIFNEYQIKLSIILDSINIQIQKQNSFDIYEYKFNIEYLQQYKLLMPNSNINEMIEFINDLINEKKIQIEENENNVKLRLLGTIKKQDVELTLNKKNIIPNKILEKLMNDIKKIKEENISKTELISNLENKISSMQEQINNNEKEKSELYEKNKELISKSTEQLEK